MGGIKIIENQKTVKRQLLIERRNELDLCRDIEYFFKNYVKIAGIPIRYLRNNE